MRRVQETRILVASALIAALVGCTAISAVATPNPTTNASQSPGAPTGSLAVLPSIGDVSSPPASQAVLPSVQPTTEPSTAEPSSSTPEPTVKPTRSPKPTTAPAPNLVVSRFEVDPGPIVAEIPFDVTVTLRNNGSADAGPFMGAVQENNLDDGVEGPFDPFPVDGLAAGKSVALDISVTLPKEGNWKLSAIADFQEDVDESNEDDNSTDSTVKVLAGLPDFAWSKDGFSVFDAFDVTADGHKIELEAKFTNSGTAIYSSSPISIGVKWYRSEDSASGDLIPLTYADDLEPGGTVDLSKIDFLPGPGTYTLYAYLDDGRAIDELSEDNNEQQADLTVN